MQELFLSVVKLSLIGSLFAVAVVLVRLLFQKAPRWIFVLLWGVVALRLIVPFSIESNLSLVPDPVATGQIISHVGDNYVGDVTFIYEGNAGYSNALEAGRQPIQSEQGDYVVTQKDSLDAPKTVEDTVYPVLSWIWLAGMVLMFGYTAVSFLLLKGKMGEATALRDNIWQCEQADSPFVLGVIRPRIYLPYTVTEPDFNNVIAHEQAHIRRKDHWWKPIGFLLLAIHWFNPVMWIAYILLCRDIEAACDEKVIRSMDKEEMRAYSTALLNCSVHRHRIAACPLAFGEMGVKERIKRVMHYKKPAFWIIIAAAILCVIVAVCFMTIPPINHEATNPTTDHETTAPATNPSGKLLQDNQFDEYLDRENFVAGLSQSDFISKIETYRYNNESVEDFAPGVFFDGPSGGGLEYRGELFEFINEYSVTEDGESARYFNLFYTEVNLDGLALPYDVTFDDTLSAVLQKLGIDIDPQADFVSDKEDIGRMTLYRDHTAYLKLWNYNLLPMGMEEPTNKFELEYTESYQSTRQDGRVTTVTRSVVMKFAENSHKLLSFRVHILEQYKRLCDHQWLMPTGPACAAPWGEICNLCGEERGDPTPHCWIESEDGQSRTCMVCGEGDSALTP